jgi:DNA-binding HxlR family transcriptional regulator
MTETAEAGPRASSLRRALAVLGDPWTMLILKEAFNGTRRFGAFRANLGIPRQTLSLRLGHLCREQLLRKRYAAPGAATVVYAPTPKAFDLAQAMYSVWLWHRANPGAVDVLPFDILHAPCGAVLSADYACTTCARPATPETVTLHPAEPAQTDPPRTRLARRKDGAFTAGGAATGKGLIAASLVGDAPCNEILWELFRRPRHMLALARELQLGAAVLRDRLDKLIALGLVRERAEGRRAVFSVERRAAAFHPLLLALSEWGDRWCNGEAPPPEQRVHDCGALLEGRFRCRACGGWVTPATIELRRHGAAVAAQ